MFTMLNEILYPLLDIDVKTLVSVLFWGNMISAMLVYSFRVTSPFSRNKAPSTYYVLAKLFQSIAFFLLFFRGNLPEILSVNGGNSLLLFGFYWEARSMLSIIQADTGGVRKTIGVTAFCCIALFNVAEMLYPNDPSLRVFLASICVFLTLFIPTTYLLFSRNTSNFKRVVGLFYLFFLTMLLPRAGMAITFSLNLHSNAFIQTLTFLSLVLLMIFSLPAYLLLIKEDTDKILHAMATTDALTGLPNRHSFVSAAKRLHDRHKASNSSLALIFFDIDDFKVINDQRGHGFGDEILKHFATALNTGVRAMDIPCRYGGEEFLLLLPRADAKVAASVAKRIMEAFRSILEKEQPGFICTVSGGIRAGVPAENDTLETDIRRADQALYDAKATGKNKAVLWTEP